MKLLFWLVVVLIAGVLALFAASNRMVVGLGWWPLPFVVELPLYLPILLALLVGFVAGALAAWAAGHDRRREARRRGRRIAALERELAATQAALPGTVERLPAPLATRV
jgi:putative membrane protein